MSLIDTPYGAFINGKFQTGRSGDVIGNINPSTGGTICDYTPCDEQDVEQAIAVAEAAFNDGRWRKLAPAVKAVRCNALRI